MIRKIIAGLTVMLSLGSPALANHWTQTADPQVVQALNELVGFYGGYCQQGSAEACQMTQAVQQHGAQMLSAGYECQANRDAQACQFYAVGPISSSSRPT